MSAAYDEGTVVEDPAVDWFEREGTIVDVDGNERDVDRVLAPRGEIDSDREIIAALQEVAA